MPAALRSAAGPVHAWHEHCIYLAYLVCGVDKTELDHCLHHSLPISKKGGTSPMSSMVYRCGAALNVHMVVYVMY